jgi:hypothetical protein
MTTRGEINSNFYQIVNVDINGAPTSIKNQYIANATVGNAVHANVADVANSVNVSNVVGIGNIATVNLTGNGSQVLLGNGTWGAGGNPNKIENGNSNVSVPTSNGNIYINANSSVDKQWNFDTTGNLSLPGNGVIGDVYNDGGVGLKANSGGYAILASNDLDQYVQADNTAVYIGTNYPANNHTWTFQKDGNTSFPGGSTVNLGNLATSNYFSGNGSLLTGVITANANYSNFAGNAVHANVSDLANSVSGANVSGVVANATYAVTSGTAYSVSGSNVSGQVANALVAGTVYTNAQPNITSVGTLTGLTSSANITAPYFIGNVVGNISGNIVVPGLQWDILYNDGGNAGASDNFKFDATSNILTVTGNVTANYYSGNGSLLTSITGANITGIVGNATHANIADVANSVSGSNVTGVVANANYSTYSGTAYSVSGSNVSGQVANALVANTVYGNDQPNITGVGTLGSLAVTGNISTSNLQATTSITTVDLTVTGNANITGNINQISGNSGQFFGNVTTGFGALYAGIPLGYSNVPQTVLQVAGNYDGYIDINLQNINSGANASTDMSLLADNGNALNYFIDMGITSTAYDSAGEFTSLDHNDGYVYVIGGDTTGTHGNLILGSATPGAQVKFIVGGANIENIAAVMNEPNTVSTNNTSGTVTIKGGLGITGNLYGGNLINANYFSGNGSLLTGITSTTGNANYANYAGNAFNVSGSNVSGQVSNSLISGTVYTNAQPNITSVGTLTSLNVTGNITNGNITGGNLISANYHSGNGSLLSSITGANVTGYVPNANIANTAYSVSGSNVTGQVANALIAGTVYTNSQPNITSVGTLSSLSVTGNITSGNIAGGNLISGNYHSGNGSLLSSITGANVTGVVANATYATSAGTATSATTAGTVTTNAQPNITSVGVLTGLTSGGTVNFTTSSNVSLGAVGNVKITGGTNNYVLKTDGAGNLSWVAQSGGGGSPGGSNTYVQFNDNGSFGGSVNLTFDKTSNYVTANNLAVNNTTSLYGTTQLLGPTSLNGTFNNYGTMNLASNSSITITGGSSGQYLKTDGAGSLSWSTVTASPGGSNTQIQYNDNGSIAGSANLTFDNTSNTLTTDYFIGNGSQLSSINGSNVTGTVSSASFASTAGVAATVTSNAQANITSVGLLTGLSFASNGNITMSGTGSRLSGGNLVSANYISGNGSLLTAITGANVTGTVSSATSATTAGTVTTAAQPNITSVGTLTSLSVTGNITTGNISSVGLGNIANVLFTKYNETVVAGGSTGAATLTPNAAAGTIYNYTLTGNITINALGNAVAGTGMTLILTQDATGGRTLTSTMKFLGGSKTLSTAASAIDIMSVFYDGTTYYASLGKGYA